MYEPSKAHREVRQLWVFENGLTERFEILSLSAFLISQDTAWWGVRRDDALLVACGDGDPPR
jgi:hypothetical protein